MARLNYGRLFAAILVLGCILSLSLMASHWLNSLTGDLIIQLEQAETLALEGDWDSASDLTQQVADCWSDSSFPLHVLMRHSETDEIQISFHQVLEYLEQEDENLYTAANGQLVTQLELLAEMERPSWENVL